MFSEVVVGGRRERLTVICCQSLNLCLGTDVLVRGNGNGKVDDILGDLGINS